jgi:hypothetical protein
MARFPVDAPLRMVIKTLESLGFRMVREGNHIAMPYVHQPDRTATGLGWDGYWICGSAGYDGR